MNTRNDRPIGVFDSGVGGLTVVHALMERLPLENIVYFGDTARVPYGTKSRATIENFTQQIVQFLLEQDVKAIVIACNTIAAVATDKVTQMAGNMPVLNVISAGANAAIQATKTGHIGVMATLTTVNSNAYARAIHSQRPEARIVSQACPLLVPIIEEGWLDTEVTRLTCQEYLKPILVENLDTLVLGCTHYPLLKPLIAEMTPNITLVDSAITAAEDTAQALQKAGLLNENTGEADYRFFVSDIPLRFQSIGERFLGRSLEQIEMVNMG